jgi:hypothetical protein
MKIEFIITIIISLIAVAISFAVYKQINKNHKQNILVSKIERIFFIIEKLTTNYYNFFELTRSLDIHYDDAIDEDLKEKNNIYEKYSNKLNELKNRIDVDNIIKETIELQILAQAYLSKNTRLKVLSFNMMFRDLIAYTIQMQRIFVKLFWKEGFPKFVNVKEYADNLCETLLEEIGFVKGIKIFREELRDYSEKEFKKDMGLVNNDSI